MKHKRHIPLADADAGYIRVSGIDLDNYVGNRQLAYEQIIRTRTDELREHAARQGRTIPDELLFIDMEISGTSLERRPGMGKLIEAASRGEFARIWTRNLSRAFRNLEEQIATLKILEKHLGIQVISLHEPSEGEAPLIELIRNTMGAFNQYFAQNTGILIKAANRRVAMMGRLPTGRAPMGYTYDRATKMMTPDPIRAAHVVRLFELYAETRSLTATAQALNAEGIPTVGGQSEWRHQKVEKTLTNPIYRGRITYAGEEFPGRHELIVPADLLQRVDAALAAKLPAGPTGPRNPAKMHTYSRLLVCGLCGSSIRALPTGLSYWTCSGRHDRRDCDLPNYRTEELDQFVLEGLQIALTASLSQMQGWLDTNPAAAGSNGKRRPSRQARIQQLHDAQDRISDALGVGAMPIEQYSRLMKRYEVELQSLGKEPEETKEQPHLTAADILKFREKLTQAWQGATPAERRHLIGDLLERIIVLPDQLILHTRLPVGQIAVPTNLFEPVIDPQRPAGDESAPTQDVCRFAPGRIAGGASLVHTGNHGASAKMVLGWTMLGEGASCRIRNCVLGTATLSARGISSRSGTRASSGSGGDSPGEADVRAVLV